MEFRTCDRCGELGMIYPHQCLQFDGEDRKLCEACWDDLKEWFNRSDEGSLELASWGGRG